MKSFFVFVILLLCLGFAFGQNEQSPIVEKEIKYKDWTYKNVRTGEDVNLRNFTTGKKLVIVVYFAPWCHNWQHDAPMLESFTKNTNRRASNLLQSANTTRSLR